MPQKVIINFSDAQIAKIGACKNQADFQAAVDLALEEQGAPKTEQKVVTLEDVQKIVAKQAETFTANSSELATKITALEGKSLDEAAILKKAEDRASFVAAQQLGKVGATGAGAATPSANDGNPEGKDKKDFSAIVADYVTSGKTKSQAVLAAIVSNPKEYAEARAKGHIKL